MIEINRLNHLEQEWDRTVPHLVADPSSYWYGSTEITKRNVTDLIVHAVSLYSCEHSRYYRNPQMLERIEAAGRHLLKRQHASGCVSLIDCNIDSPPDTAFAVFLIGMACKTLEQSGLAEGEGKEAGKLLHRFLERSRECLATGGVHTPNHRWVMCGALAMLYERFPEERLKQRAFEYLNEGFDLTPYGEWTERSNAVYNAHCCLSLFHVYRVFGHVPSLEAAKLNLDMMRYMLHPDESIVTEFSSRQDRGKRRWMSSTYEIAYRLLASETNLPDMIAMAKLASQSPEAPSPELLAYWLVFPDRMNVAGREETAVPERYTKLFDSGRQVRVPKQKGNPGGFGPVHGATVLRHRDGPWSVTVMAGQTEWLFVQYGEARMSGLRLVPGYFGLGGVSFPTIRQTGERTYRLEVELEWGYMGPLDQETARSSNGSFVDMPHEQRPQTHVCRLPVTVDMTLEDNVVNLSIAMESEYPLIVQLAAVFDETGTLEGDHIHEVHSHLYQLRANEGVFRKGNDWLRLSPGAYEHGYEVVRGDTMDREQINLTVNWMGAASKQVRIEGGTA
ncbi:MAG: hypothetical protein K0Q59_3503 [Paenibacillus sp.]|nr:hypothetical protein [Paenibacillus sp.]